MRPSKLPFPILLAGLAFGLSTAAPACSPNQLDAAVASANVVIALGDVAEPEIAAWNATAEQRCLALPDVVASKACVNEARKVTRAYEAYWKARALFASAVEIARAQREATGQHAQAPLDAALGQLLKASAALRALKLERLPDGGA